MDEKRLITIAALMHDIGKFMQRGAPEIKVGHSQFSEAFFSPEKLRLSFNEDEGFLSALRFLVSHHHESDLDASNEKGRLRVLSEILSEADNISSGERSKSETGNIQMLKPILSEVDFENKPKQDNLYYDLNPLSFDGKGLIFPKEGLLKENEIEEKYKKHWHDFIKEYETVIKGKLTPDALYYLLQKYLWCVPSAYFYSTPDISLFEHSKVTAAVAVSMYETLKQTHTELFNDNLSPEEIRKIVKDRGEKRYLFVVIDINGIQNFIYSISSKKALQSLKGRSFYVELLSLLVTHEILWNEAIDLYETNIIYAGGGKTYLLLPITVKGRLEEIARKIELSLFKEFKERLSISVAFKEISANDIAPNNIKNTWRSLNEALSEEKQKKFASIIQTNYDEIFKPEEGGGYFNGNGVGDTRTICAICRKEIPESDSVEIDTNEEEPIKVCKECNTFIEIGKKLASDESNKLFLVIGNSADNNNKEVLPITVKGFKTSLYLTKNPYDVKLSGRKLTLNMTTTELYNNAHGDFGFMHNVSRKPPVTTLEEFADKSLGAHRIGVLRMDVDNLGKIFMKGFKNDEDTLSRKSQLSSSISMFFKGIVKEIASSEEFSDSIYVIYSGGDDLFALGKWDKIPLFAKKVHDDFKRYACNNPNISVSGGIFLMKNKYPIARSAVYAGKMENLAKNYKYKEHKKDALSFFGKAIGWNDFYIATKMTEAISQEVNEKNNKALIRKLERIYTLYELVVKSAKKEKLTEEEIERRAKWSKWMWMLAYYIGRDKKNLVLSNLGQALTEDVFNGIKSEKPIISYLDVPVSWADLLTRRD